jgi:hypothetical protein
MAALDRLNKQSAKPASKKTDKIAAVVPNEMKATVDEIINLKARIKADEAALAEKESTVIEHVRAQQDEHAFAGNFSKSFEVPGNQGSLLYNTSDRFSVPQEEDAKAAIRACVSTHFDDMFEEKSTISIKAAVLTNDTLLNQILDACEGAGLSVNDIFDQVVKLTGKKDLDQKQYQLTPNKLATFRTLVRQNKPALK